MFYTNKLIQYLSFRIFSFYYQYILNIDLLEYYELLESVFFSLVLFTLTMPSILNFKL